MNETAVYVLNNYIENDSIIKAIFHPVVPNIYPGFAEEPLGGKPSYPYIRYFSVPVIQRTSPYIRRDMVQYYVGAKDVPLIAKLIERLIYILDSPDQDTAIIPDVAGQYKIMNTMVNSSTPLTLPSQDEGVWEQGIAITMVYTISKHNFANEVGHNLDSLLQ